jgi:hypothetical protein
MAIDLHLFVNKKGNPSASITDTRCVRSKHVELGPHEMLLVVELVSRLAEAGRADGKNEPEVAQ